MAPHFLKGLSETGKKALAVEKIGPRRPMTRKRLIGAPGTNFFSLGQKTVFGMGGDYNYIKFSAYRPYSTQKIAEFTNLSEYQK
jgi:hypothetical protein